MTSAGGPIAPIYVHGLFVAAELEWASKDGKWSFSRSSTAVDVDADVDQGLLAATEFEWDSKDGISSTVVATVAEHWVRKKIGSLYLAVIQSTMNIRSYTQQRTANNHILHLWPKQPRHMWYHRNLFWFWKRKKWAQVLM